MSCNIRRAPASSLSLFPAGFQVIPLYVLANVDRSFAFALLALFRARDPASLALAAVFGACALYLMINPSKASYSVAPTMMVCAARGLSDREAVSQADRGIGCC